MAEAIHLPKVGMTMEEGPLCRWLIADGDPVARGQPLFEMETEKVEMEVEADGDGLLKQLVPEGTLLKPGDIVGCLLRQGEQVPQALLDRVAAQITEEAFDYLDGPPLRVGAPFSPVPYSPVLEKAWIPGADQIVAKAQSLLGA